MGYNQGMTIITDNQYCLSLLNDALRALQGNKKDAKDKRAWAETITKLEQTIAYFESHVISQSPVQKGMREQIAKMFS